MKDYLIIYLVNLKNYYYQNLQKLYKKIKVLY